jgi:hypothetical protein
MPWLREVFTVRGGRVPNGFEFFRILKEELLKPFKCVDLGHAKNLPINVGPRVFRNPSNRVWSDLNVPLRPG